MSDVHNPYAPPQTQQLSPQPAAPPAAPHLQWFAGGQLPDLGRAFSDTMSSFSRDIGAYAMAGLGLLVISIPISLVMIVGIYVVIGLAVFGMASAGSVEGGEPAVDPALSVVVGAGAVAAFLAVILLLMVLLAPVTASLMRAVARHQRGERRLEFGAAFSTLSQDAGSVCGSTALSSLLGSIGGIFCYVPGLIVAFFLAHSFALVALHRLPAIAALKASVALVRASVGWNAKYFGLLLLINMIASNVPLIGPMFTFAFLVRVSRELLGDAEQPVLELRPASPPGPAFPR